MSTWTSIRSELALATRYGASEDRLAELRRDLKAARLEEAITQAVENIPPLTAEQRAHLAAILRPAVDAQQTS